MLQEISVRKDDKGKLVQERTRKKKEREELKSDAIKRMRTKLGDSDYDTIVGDFKDLNVSGISFHY
jgi:hypothetical protein